VYSKFIIPVFIHWSILTLNFSTGPEGIGVFNPEGILFGKIKFPLKTANLAFGGEDRRSLFITCSSYLIRLRLKTHGISPLDDRG
jgi:gluconolactonase